jgi:hypothetical protein
MARGPGSPRPDARRVISTAAMPRRYLLILLGVGVLAGGGTVLGGALGEEPTAIWAGALTLALFLALALGRATMTAHPREGLVVSVYGIFRAEIPWESIEGVERAAPTGLLAGMGLRRLRGGVTGYLVGGDSVLITTRDGRYRVSVRRPDRVVQEIDALLGERDRA